MTDTAAPSFVERTATELPVAFTEFLPEQGSYEVQHDQPGKTHNWHRHSLDEELWVVSGDVSLFWHDPAAGGVRTQSCPAGTLIRLPAGTIHGSTAGSAGAVYVIRPQGGATATTTWLDEHEFPDHG